MFYRKLSITLLSLFFVCTSNAMESMAVVSSAGSDAMQEDEPVEMVSSLRSLKNLAIAQVQRNVHRELKEDVATLQKNGQLTPENVEKNLFNQIALLSVPDELKEKILQAYRDSPRWYSIRPSSAFLNHMDSENWIERHAGSAVEDKSEYVVFCNPNSDASQVAVIAETRKWVGVERSCTRLLYLWREAADEWRKKLQQTVSESAEDVVWPSDNSLLVASKNDITIFKRQKDDDDFTARYTVPITRCSAWGDMHFNILSMRSGHYQADHLWFHFGRFSWNEEKNHLAVETKRGEGQSELVTASLKKDGSIECTQTIKIALKGILGIRSIEWDEDGGMHVLFMCYDLDNFMHISVYRPDSENGTYELNTQYVFSRDGIMIPLKEGKNRAVSNDEKSYFLSQRQRDAIRSMDPMSKCPSCENMPIAIREHPEETLRFVGYARESGKRSFNEYGFSVWGHQPTIRTLCERLCRDAPRFWRLGSKYEDI